MGYVSIYMVIKYVYRERDSFVAFRYVYTFSMSMFMYCNYDYISIFNYACLYLVINDTVFKRLWPSSLDALSSTAGG